MKRIIWIGAIMTAIGTLSASVLLVLTMTGTALTNLSCVPYARCPMPVGAHTIRPQTQMSAWHRAKLLSGLTGIEGWDIPCKAVRYNKIFVGDPDGNGGLPYGEYLGLHHPPDTGILHDTGEVITCEYITVHLPPGLEKEAYDVLTHEFLHAIFFRMWHISPAFREKYDPDQNEAWVRTRMGDKAWLLIHAPEGKL